MTDPAVFDDLGDAEKVKYVTAELPATGDHLDKLIKDYDQTFAALEHPKGYASFELGCDGRLCNLRVADDIGKVMDNLQFENMLNKMFAEGSSVTTEMLATIMSELGL
ncbi:hypothetical protein FZI85_27490 [Mycobacterium sp. CBMA293]|uniref:Nucleoid-associated protein YbaB n=1 Tax=Mycolicibacterium sp. CBMA 213 TaxID=1968788 RepID=A0A1S6GKQ4_9MYCO|nr:MULTISPECIES: hypothetical protein [unclassified Mycolicibacterium]AQS22438.1 hypothetical protein pCBMA213_2_00074 [Mycolicibacterium sp. CBMA 213]MUL48340.1 hypothetical protein [Mycolicibacterium sp. CBMA 360]MUL62351.1 hypothetical protein [Mycolicibacterium sp. CBMA 335]MUM04489.1 hypothetical protein [Mycolicibacterium sp. CBMA 213]MUM14751.1 hypothetical protein [Mycolicibacterium sp. CBMA 293]